MRCRPEKKLKNTGVSIIADAQRKRVTALFSDLSGYTAMTEKCEPEEIKEITSRIFEFVRQVVNRYEGFIERFVGDGAMVLFGAPTAHEDDPLRAAKRNSSACGKFKPRI